MGHFNALKSFDRLKNAGVSEQEARAIIETIEESTTIYVEGLATKTDILKLEGQLNELKISVNWLQRLFFGSVFLIIINIAVTFLHH